MPSSKGTLPLHQPHAASLTKLCRRAIYTVEDETCESVTQLIDLLNGAFGSPKTIDQYRGELSTIFLRPHKHILDYISCTKDLRTSIDVTRRAEYLITEMAAEIDALTARSFCDGLLLNYWLQLTKELYSNTFAAFSHIKALIKRQKLDSERFEGSRRYEYSTSNVIRPLAHSTPL